MTRALGFQSQVTVLASGPFFKRLTSLQHLALDANLLSLVPVWLPPSLELLRSLSYPHD